MSEHAERIARQWLAEMQACVRAQDYARCRAIFAADVVGFGTRAAVAVGLESLERDQWRHVWGRTRNFTFNVSELRCGLSGDHGLWLCCPWSSEAPNPDGIWRARPGRMTAVLERRDGQWLAVHTHHSLIPELAGVE
jgi:ketosteroid isomerase-like protein